MPRLEGSPPASAVRKIETKELNKMAESMEDPQERMFGDDE